MAGQATQLIALSGAAVNLALAEMAGLVNKLDYRGGNLDYLGAPVSFSVAGSQGMPRTIISMAP